MTLTRWTHTQSGVCTWAWVQLREWHVDCEPLPILFVLISFWLHCVFIALLGFSLAVASEGYSLVAVRVLLIAVACLVAEHKGGLQ